MIIQTSPFLDIHAHAREPGQTHKATVADTCAAAAAGGFGAFAAMANTVPVIDTPELVRFVKGAAVLGVTVYPVAAVTVGQRGEALTDFAALKAAGAAALSDDGLPLTSEKLLKEALTRADALKLPVLLHCEPETRQAEQAVFWIKRLGCPAHICHVSKADTAAVLRKARREGVLFTAETCPHYMTVQADGKMNPPLGTERDVEAVLDALCDGVIDCVATDHAPHTAEEKASPNPPNGVVGLETALGVVLEALFRSGRMPLDSVLRLMSGKPAAVLRVPVPPGVISVDTDAEWVVNPELLLSGAKNTPFAGMRLRGKVVRGDVG
ncbi:MAG: amidohydrolase family protein [Oscillospiraceae bacterium]|jgi:dihydroorotase|nr:amidohydrolase family protein [Oscillospiraceae bacterium]